jgi:hypothetical protein
MHIYSLYVERVHTSVSQILICLEVEGYTVIVILGGKTLIIYAHALTWLQCICDISMQTEHEQILIVALSICTRVRKTQSLRH